MSNDLPLVALTQSVVLVDSSVGSNVVTNVHGHALVAILAGNLDR